MSSMLLNNKENAGPQKILEYDILKAVHNLIEYEDKSGNEDPKVIAYKDNVKNLLQNLVKKLDDNYKRNTFLEHEILRLKREHEYKTNKVQKELKETKEKLESSEQKFQKLKRQRDRELGNVLSFAGRIQEKLDALNKNFVEEIEPTEDENDDGEEEENDDEALFADDQEVEDNECNTDMIIRDKIYP